MTASVSITHDPLGNTSYSYEWEFILPSDVSIAPTTVAGGGSSDAFWTFAARLAATNRRAYLILARYSRLE